MRDRAAGKPVRHAASEILLVCTIDTEEDNWQPARTGIECRNVGELPAHQRWLEALGVRPTYLVTHRVLDDARGAGILREIAGRGTAGMGAHLHPWNTPPLHEALEPRTTMLCNLDPLLQLAKLERLGEDFERVFGTAPTVFRAGRCGLGPATVDALVRLGYRCDSSVAPFHDLRAEHGPDFTGAPVDAYEIAAGEDPARPHRGGALLELPLSVGYSRRPFARWHRVRERLAGGWGRRLQAPGIAARTRLLTKALLTPERESARDLALVARRLVEEGARYLMLVWHSPTLRPGCTPYGRTAADVERLRARLAGFLDAASRHVSLRAVTLGEAAARLAPPAAAAVPDPLFLAERP